MENILKILKNIIIIIILFIILSFLIINIFLIYEQTEVKNYSEYETTKASVSTAYEQNVETMYENNKKISDMLEKATGYVVGISKLTTTGGSILNNVTNDSLGLGTGIIVSENGYILSNSHVTGEKYSTCFITVDENTYKGNVVWSEADLDLSIVKIQVNNLQYCNFGNSDSIRLGEQVYAIGNPIGYEFKRTITSGIVSAKNRTIKINENDDENYVSDLIQTDATINPGNSGGPLVNIKGAVIGINTIKITSAEGIGFAIPINVIKPVVESFVKTGNFTEASLDIYAFDSKVAEYLKYKEKIGSGIYVAKVTPHGAASKSELKEGDLITAIDQNRLNTINDLRRYIYTKNPGEVVVLKVIRDGKEKEIDIILGKKATL